MLKKSPRRIFLVVALLLVQAGVYYTVSAKEIIPNIAPWSQFPAQVSSWKTRVDVPLDPQVLAALQPDDYLNRDYIQGNQAINLFIAYFNSRRDGRAPHSPEWCLPGSGWKPFSNRVVSIPALGEPRPVPVDEYVVDKTPERALVVYWYHQGEYETPSELSAQLYAIPDMLMHSRTDTSIVRIIAPVRGGRLDEARNAAFGFARDVYPLIRRQIK